MQTDDFARGATPLKPPARHTWRAGAVGAILGLAACAPAPDFAALESDLRQRIAEVPGTVAVALSDLEHGRRLGIADTVPMHAASTMKVPVLMEVYRQAAAGHFELDDTVGVRTAFTSIVDGSVYTLSPRSDSDAALYERVGDGVSIRELARRMITRSSNLATNLLIERVSADSIQATMARLGAGRMRVLRGVEDIPAYRRGMNNTTTARAFARVLESLVRCDVAGPAACREMIAVLEDQEFTEKIPAGVPPDVRVANKTGWITEIDHDGAIVFPPRREPYVLVVLTAGIADTLVSRSVAVDISRRVWEELGRD